MPTVAWKTTETENSSSKFMKFKNKNNKHFKTKHSTENNVDNLTNAFTSIYLHCMCVQRCILDRYMVLFYVYLLNNWQFGAIKNTTKIRLFLQLNLYNCVDFYK